ncbi:hypothetical protein C0J45_15762 [Silurus meridionalis]|nr:hypothetical protein C0J45_15762 [Silurus meridionalis]
MAVVQNAVLLITLAIAVQEYNGVPKRTRYALHPPCLDLLIVERMTQRVSKVVKYLHSCVLEKIIEFYENVLSSDQYIQTYHPDLISTLEKVRNCSYKLNHTTIRETAMDELKSLHHYILGRAFRKTNG